MVDIFLLVLLIIIAVYMTSVIAYINSRGKIFKHFFHDVIGCHIPDYEKPLEIDGFDNIYAHCKVCGKEIIRDSRKVSDWKLK